MSVTDSLLRPDLGNVALAANCSDPSTSSPPFQQQQANSRAGGLDSRSFGIGIAIGIVITLMLVGIFSVMTVTFRRGPKKVGWIGAGDEVGYTYRSRERTTMPLAFSIPKQIGTAKNRNRQAPAPAVERLSLESHIVLAPRSPSPELVLDIAPGKGKGPSPPSPSTPVAPDQVDIREMRSMNTFSGRPTTSSNATTPTARRPQSSPGMEFFPGDPLLLGPGELRSRHLHHRLSEYDTKGTSSSALTHVRRVQSTSEFDSAFDRKLANELEWTRTRGMGHTLPRPEPAKTISRPGTSGTATNPMFNGVGTWTTTEFPGSRDPTPLSSASSLGVHLTSSGGVSPSTTSGNGTSAQASPYPSGSHLGEKDPRERHRRRRRKDGSKTSLTKHPHPNQSDDTLTHPIELTPLASSHRSRLEPELHRPPSSRHSRSPSHSHSHNNSISLAGGQGIEDIAPPPYNIANVPSSRSRDRLPTSSNSQTSLTGLDMGFGASHHARNHLL